MTKSRKIMSVPKEFRSTIEKISKRRNMSMSEVLRSSAPIIEMSDRLDREFTVDMSPFVKLFKRKKKK